MSERLDDIFDDGSAIEFTAELDDMLRAWHEENIDVARRGRDRLLRSLKTQAATAAPASRHDRSHRDNGQAGFAKPSAIIGRHGIERHWGKIAARLSPPMAAAVILCVLLYFIPDVQRRTFADVIYAPAGGALTARDDAGRVLGPCPLKDTDVDVEISGRFARVTLWQTFHNPFDQKIEAVYTFPMGHNGSVDRMTMSIGDRIVIGEVHERERARQIYATARRQGFVAALLEQERPNVFTQSVANIEPGAELLVEISYVETIVPSDGVCEFAFPMVVGPRFIPQDDDRPLGDAARFATKRDGIILQAPGEIAVPSESRSIAPQGLSALLRAALPIDVTDAEAWRTDAEGQATTELTPFVARYDALAAEDGAIYSNGTGQVAGRWFVFDPALAQPGSPAVPDAARIAPPRVPPDVRAGHDISIAVALDTGGPGVVEINTPLHETHLEKSGYRNDGLPTHVDVELVHATEIPNRDFVLRWRVESDEVTDAVFAHTSDLGNFVTVMLDPPARVEADELVPRELVFVVDTSGSMAGAPLDKAKEVMAHALEALGPNDTFNVIAFSDSTTQLWNEPRVATIENIDEAHLFVANHESNGGTQMMQAVRLAIAGDQASETKAAIENLEGYYESVDLAEFSQLPADGRYVVVRINAADLVPLPAEHEDDAISAAIDLGEDGLVPRDGLGRPLESFSADDALLVMGWLRSDSEGYALLQVDEVGPVRRPESTLTPAGLLNQPADGRRVSLIVKCENIDGFTDAASGEWLEGIAVGDDDYIFTRNLDIHDHDDASAMLISGRWVGGGDPTLVVDSRIHVPREWTEPRRMRVICFLTDGEVGNDMSIIDEIARTAGRTRFFSLGIGNGANRYLLDGMAKAGRGACEVVLLDDEADAVVERFVRRMRAPVLLNPRIEFSDGLDVYDMQPSKPGDLFDETPIVIHARYDHPGVGTVTIRGDAADGPFERTIAVELPENEPSHDTIASMWARAKVDSLMQRDLTAVQRGGLPESWRQEIVELGERFQILTQYTSFVAVERLRVTLDGESMRIHIPVETPEGTSPQGDIAERLMESAAAYEALPERVDREIAVEQYVRGLAAAQPGTPIGESQAPDSDGDDADVDRNDASGDPCESVHYYASAALTNREGDAEIFADFRETEKAIHLSVLDGDFDRAYALLDQTRASIDADPGDSGGENAEDLTASLLALEGFVEDEDRQWNEDQIREKVAEVEAREQGRIALIQETKSRQVEQLMERATELRKERRLREAIEVLEQVLTIEPEHGQAKWMLETLEDLAQSLNDRDTVHERHHKTREVLIENDWAGVPYHEDMTYPKNWPEITARRRSNEERNETAMTRQTREKLMRDHAPEISFDGLKFEQVINRLRALTGLNIVPNWAAMEKVAIERDAEVSLSASNLTYQNILDLILDEVGGGEVDLGYEIDDGIVRISTMDDINSRPVDRVYDVRYLLPPTATPKDATDSDGDQATEPADAAYTVLVALIQNEIDPESWQDFGGKTGSISTLNGQLVVTQSRPNQYKLEQLLAELQQGSAASVLTSVGLDAEISIPTEPFGQPFGQPGLVDAGEGAAGYRYQPRSDLAIDAPTAALSKKGTDIFRVEVRGTHDDDNFGRLDDSAKASGNLYLGAELYSAGEFGETASAVSDAQMLIDARVGRDFLANDPQKPLAGPEVPTMDHDFRLAFVPVEPDAARLTERVAGVPMLGDIPAFGTTRATDSDDADSTNNNAANTTGSTRRLFHLSTLTQEQAKEMIESIRTSRSPKDVVDLNLVGGRTFGAMFQGFDGAPDERSNVAHELDESAVICPPANRIVGPTGGYRGARIQGAWNTDSDDSMSPFGYSLDGVPYIEYSNSAHPISQSGVGNAANARSRDDITPTAGPGAYQIHGATAYDGSNLVPLDWLTADTQTTSKQSVDSAVGASDSDEAVIEQAVVEDTESSSAGEAHASSFRQRIVPAMQFEAQPLEHILQCVFEAIDGAFSIDQKAFEAVKFDATQPVSVAFEAGKLVDVLPTILAAVNGPALDYVEIRGKILITAQNAMHRLLGLGIAEYDLGDFFADADLPEPLPCLPMLNDHKAPTQRIVAYLNDLAQAFARTHAGRIMTGAVVDGDRIRITQTPAFHRAVGDWLAGARQARFAEPSAAADVYRVAARLKAGEIAGLSDDVLAVYSHHRGDPLARQFVDAVLGAYSGGAGPPPSPQSVMTAARKSLEAAAARSERLAKCVDPALLALMAGGTVEGLRTDARGVTVTVLLADTQPATIDALRECGLIVESVVESAKVAVGVIPLSRLGNMAMVDGVRSIEPTRSR